MTDPPDSRHAWAEASQWVARIGAAVAVMVLPALGGHWLDGRLGTSFLVLIGLVLGMAVGMYYLVLITGALEEKQADGDRDQEDQS